MLRLLTRQSPVLAFVESLALLFAVHWFDLATGHEESVVVFYTVPIIFAVWLCDNKVAVVVSGLAGVLWLWGDLARGTAYPSATVQAGEIATRLVFFFLVALAGIGAKEKHRAYRARISLLEHAQRLEKQIIEVSEYEQQRIGRDLHDGLCQFLAAIGCMASSLRMELEERGVAKLTATAAEIEMLLGESVKQARDLAHGLVPVKFDEGGLPAALQELAASTNRLFPLECRFEFAGNNGLPRNAKATHLYRIAQEAINNATRHAKPRRIDIRLSTNCSATSLSVADDGAGFSKTKTGMNGVGISIMRYRANLLGGELEIEDAPHGGTIISCTVPVRA